MNLILKFVLLSVGFVKIINGHDLAERYENCRKKFQSTDNDLMSDAALTDFHVKERKNLTLWPNAEIPTEFDKNFTPHELQRLACVFLYFRAFTCIKFVKREQHKDYLRIAKSGPSCFTEFIGKSSKGGSQQVNFGKKGCWHHGIILHELMHVAGRFGEHKRLDRDEHIHIHWKNVPKYYTTQYHQVEHRMKDVGEYDIESIMHIARNINGECGRWTITAKVKNEDYDQQYKDNQIMGQRIQATNQDTRKLNLLYKCDQK